jgi:integrase/recombinase XerD
MRYTPFMYSLYRRHELTCRFRQKGVRQIKCSCPVWMDGFDEQGKRRRQSLKTRSWSQAQARLQDLERGIAPPALEPHDASPRIEAAIASFLDDCRARSLAPATIATYRSTLQHLEQFFPGCRLRDLNLEALTRYRSARAQSATETSRMELARIRTLFRFCEDRDWIAKNPAKLLRLPKADRTPTMPFTPEEIHNILAACDSLADPRREQVQRTRARARALVLTLLYSGLRVSDVVKLERSKLDMQTGRLLIRMMKTGAPLYVRLPPDALAALQAVPIESINFFWNGKSKLTSAIHVASRTIEHVFVRAGIEGGHPHRFRDTFSVELLKNGTDIRTVQLLLGHTSIKTTEKHYAPYVASMQRALDEAVSSLHFCSTPDGHALMNAEQDALGNTQGNVLPFARSKSA